MYAIRTYYEAEVAEEARLAKEEARKGEEEESARKKKEEDERLQKVIFQASEFHPEGMA